MNAGSRDFLKKISQAAILRVASARIQVSEAELFDEIAKRRHKPHDFVAKVRCASGGVLPEIKRRSPSRGEIAMHLPAVEVARQYVEAGAQAISVLTEPHHFGGALSDLARVRERFPEVALLRKDFILDRYQLLEARAAGADAVLLIHAMLGETLARELQRAASELGLAVLLEVHDEGEMRSGLGLGSEMVGVNNRCLQELTTDLGVSRRLAPEFAHMKGRKLFISESGVEEAADIQGLRALGYEGFLVGTRLMRGGRPGDELARLLRGLA